MDLYASVILIIHDYRECLLRHNTNLWQITGQVERFLLRRVGSTAGLLVHQKH